MTTAEDEEFAVPRQGHRVILLVGFMGAGKTSVGRVLAEQLQWRFLDLDDVVVAREGRSVARIFEESGESGFRSRESAALQESLLGSSQSANTVIALGGGSLAHPESRAMVQESGFPKIFLDAPVEELYRRCVLQGKQRPLLNDLDAFRKLYLSRLPHFSSAAIRVDTANKSLAQISSEIFALIEPGNSSPKESI